MGVSETLVHPSVATGALVAVLGYAVVFFGICLLLIVVTIMGKVMMNSQKKAAAQAPAAVPEPAPADSVEKPKAKGTAGELKLYDTDPRDAALIMAITAHKLGRPINELRFRSIKEVKEK